LLQIPALGGLLATHYWDSGPEEQGMFLQQTTAAMGSLEVTEKVLVLQKPPEYGNAAAQSSSNGQQVKYEGCMLPIGQGARGEAVRTLLGQDLLMRLGTGGLMSQDNWDSVMAVINEPQNKKRLHVFTITPGTHSVSREQQSKWDMALQDEMKPRLLFHSMRSKQRVEGGQQQAYSNTTQRWGSGAAVDELVLIQFAALLVMYPQLHCWRTMQGLQQVVNGMNQPAAAATTRPRAAAQQISLGGLIGAFQETDLRSKGTPPPPAQG
jgi:hypothetical protein